LQRQFLVTDRLLVERNLLGTLAGALAETRQVVQRSAYVAVIPGHGREVRGEFLAQGQGLPELCLGFLRPARVRDQHSRGVGIKEDAEVLVALSQVLPIPSFIWKSRDELLSDGDRLVVLPLGLGPLTQPSQYQGVIIVT